MSLIRTEHFVCLALIQTKLSLFNENAIRFIIVRNSEFFQSVSGSILLYDCTSWNFTKRLVKKLDGNYTRMLHAGLHIPWKQHCTRRRLTCHLKKHLHKTIKAWWVLLRKYVWTLKQRSFKESYAEAHQFWADWLRIELFCSIRTLCAISRNYQEK